MKDRRYKVEAEFTGHASGKKRFVVRFLGKRVGEDFGTRDEADKKVHALKNA